MLYTRLSVHVQPGKASVHVSGYPNSVILKPGHLTVFEKFKFLIVDQCDKSMTQMMM